MQLHPIHAAVREASCSLKQSKPQCEKPSCRTRGYLASSGAPVRRKELCEDPQVPAVTSSSGGKNNASGFRYFSTRSSKAAGGARKPRLCCSKAAHGGLCATCPRFSGPSGGLRKTSSKNVRNPARGYVCGPRRDPDRFTGSRAIEQTVLVDLSAVNFRPPIPEVDPERSL